MIALRAREAHVWLRWSEPGGEEHRSRDFLREALSQHSEVPPAEWSFRLNHRGRPELAEPFDATGIGFSVSHTAGLLAVAVGLGELGVDVERATARRPIARIAEDFFAPPEIALLESLPEAQRPPRFFDLWTLKEAYMKARGLGFAVELHSFTVEFDPTSGAGRLLHPPPGDPAPDLWRMRSLRLGPSHHGAVVMRSPEITHSPGSPPSDPELAVVLHTVGRGLEP